jgi:tetratricopeptide (TPR) repeat protein
MSSRLEQLQDFVKTRPDDPFPRYGLALELKNQGQLAEAADVFAELIARFPDYTPAFLHAGNTLAALKRKEDATRVYTDGIAACDRKRDLKTKGEIEAALHELESADSET